MDLIRDVLDKQVRDRKGRAMGKVDGLVLEEREGAPPRVAFVELGGGTLARRLSPRLVPLVRGLSRAIGITDGEPVRIPWSKVTKVDVEIDLDVDAEECGAWEWEKWLRGTALFRVPVLPIKK
jgi:sporulation protein YlmC with PRC-barrel domain